MTPPNVALYNYFRQSFDFKGRAARSDYWWPFLFTLCVNLVLLIIFIQGGGWEWLTQLIDWSEGTNPDVADLDLPVLSSVSKFAATFLVVFGLATFFADIAVSFRRFHDLGLPGWIHLLFMLGGAFIVFLALIELVWFIFPSNPGENKYGPHPHGHPADVFRD